MTNTIVNNEQSKSDIATVINQMLTKQKKNNDGSTLIYPYIFIEAYVKDSKSEETSTNYMFGVLKNPVQTYISANEDVKMLNIAMIDNEFVFKNGENKLRRARKDLQIPFNADVIDAENLSDKNKEEYISKIEHEHKENVFFLYFGNTAHNRSITLCDELNKK